MGVPIPHGNNSSCPDSSVRRSRRPNSASLAPRVVTASGRAASPSTTWSVAWLTAIGYPSVVPQEPPRRSANASFWIVHRQGTSFKGLVALGSSGGIRSARCARGVCSARSDGSVAPFDRTVRARRTVPL